MLAPILLSLALLFSNAEAASSSSASCSYSTTISASSALSLLNACPTLDGTIEITGNDIGPIDLSSIEEVSGDLTFFNSSSVTDINFSGLSTISGSIAIEELTQLHTVEFNNLGTVKDLSFVSLPSLAILTLTTGIQNATSIELSDTALSSLSGFDFTTISTLNVNNNKNISSIDLALSTVTENLILSFNSDNSVITLDQLKWASNLTIQDVDSLSITNMTAVNGTFVLGYNTFTTVEFEALEEVGGSLEIFANNDVTNMSFPVLSTIGGELRIFNNSDLVDMEDTFEELETVEGAVNISGDFSNFTLPALDKVEGDFTVTSTSDDFSCDEFDSLHSKSKIEGHNYTCSAKSKSSSSSSASSGSSSSTASSGSSSSSSSSSDSSSSSTTKKSNGSKLIAGSMICTTFFGTLLSILI